MPVALIIVELPEQMVDSVAAREPATEAESTCKVIGVELAGLQLPDDSTALNCVVAEMFVAVYAVLLFAIVVIVAKLSVELSHLTTDPV